jgi:hypothetical protein
VTLALTFVLLALALGVVFFGASLFLQGYLYNEPADRLPIRAAAAGVLVAAFLTAWVAVNARPGAADRYGTLFEFNPTASQPFDELDAVRRAGPIDAEGHPKETAVAYKKLGPRFVEAKNTSRPFVLTTADYMVVAVDVKEKDGETKTRYEAELDANGKYPSGAVRVFREVGGPRYIEFSQLGMPSPVYVPSRGALLGAVALNALHFAAWLAAFWLVMRFSLGHAVGLAAGFGLAAMLILMPLLFDRNRTEAHPVPQRTQPAAPPAEPPTDLK